MLGFLPLGTGNSFMRDFEDGASGISGLEHAMQALEERCSRPCDVMRLTHKDGAIYYTNLLSVGFTADVAAPRPPPVCGGGRGVVAVFVFFFFPADLLCPR